MTITEDRKRRGRRGAIPQEVSPTAAVQPRSPLVPMLFVFIPLLLLILYGALSK